MSTAMSIKTELTKADILPWADYAKDRAEHRRRITAVKRSRRVEVGELFASPTHDLSKV